MLIDHATIYPAEGEPIADGWVLTNGATIAALGRQEQKPAGDGGEVLDAGGGVVTPGFLDAHTHLGMVEDSLGFEGDDTNEATNPATPQLRAVDGVNPMDRCFDEALSAGVTAVLTGPGSANAIGGTMCVVKTRGRCVDDMLLKENAAMKFALGENPKTVYNGRKQTPMTRMGTAAVIREQLLRAQRYARRLEESRGRRDAEPPAFDFRCEALLPVLERRVQAHFHAHRADDIFTALRIANEFHLDAVIIHATEGHLIADELKAAGARVLSGPFLADRCKPELHNQTPAAPGLMAKAGLHPAIITDHPVIPIQYLPLCAGLAVRYGMPWDEALRALTIYPARILGLDGHIGSLKPGKDADLVVFDGDPFALSTHVRAVVLDGKRVK